MTELSSLPSGMPRVTAAIATRNRQNRVVDCIRSLSQIADLVQEVLVFDDGSTPALDGTLLTLECKKIGLASRLRRIEVSRGYIAARNALAEASATEYVLTLDDDVLVRDARGLRAALQLLVRDPAVSVVGFPQVGRNGELDKGFQPCHRSYACYADRFGGFSHVARRSHFLEVGGYREFLLYYGEEADLSFRLYARGYKVVFLPERSFAHLPEQAGRNQANILRFSARNSCLCALLNMPLPAAAVAMWRYLRWYKNTLRAWQISDQEGRKWVRSEILTQAPKIWRQRRPASWRTVIRWKSIQRNTPAYPFPISPDSMPAAEG
jgi:GT2 family glycosyltransferase